VDRSERVVEFADLWDLARSAGKHFWQEAGTQKKKRRDSITKDSRAAGNSTINLSATNYLNRYWYAEVWKDPP